MRLWIPLAGLGTLCAVAAVLKWGRAGQGGNLGLDRIEPPRRAGQTSSRIQKEKRNFAQRRVFQILANGKVPIDAADISALLDDPQNSQDPVFLAALYRLRPTEDILTKMKGFPDSPEVCQIMALNAKTLEERLEWAKHLGKLSEDDIVATTASIDALFQLGRNEAAIAEILSAGEETELNPARNLIESEKRVWEQLGESPGESVELSLSNGMGRQLLSSLSSQVGKLSELASNQQIDRDTHILAINKLLKRMEAIRTTLGEKVPYPLLKSLNQAEERLIEGLDPATEYGQNSTIAQRLAEVRGKRTSASRIGDEVSMALRDADAYDVNKYYQIVRDGGFVKAASWLLRKDLPPP